MSGTAGGARNINNFVTVSLVIDILVAILKESFSNSVIQSIVHMARSWLKHICCRINSWLMASE